MLSHVSMSIKTNQILMGGLPFVVLLHEPGEQSIRSSEAHFDWMFYWNGILRTWATPPMEISHTDGPIETSCEPLPEHRLAYLEYEGEVSQGRGCVTRELAGLYHLLEDRKNRFYVALEWTNDDIQNRAEIMIERVPLSDRQRQKDLSTQAWRFRYSPVQ